MITIRTALFALALITLFSQCTKDNQMGDIDPTTIGGDGIFKVTITNDFINSKVNLKAFLLSDQYGTILFAENLDDLNIGVNEGLIIEEEVTEDQVLSLTMIYNVKDYDTGLTIGFSNNTYYNISDGAVLDRYFFNDTGSGGRKPTKVKIANVEQVEYVKVNNIRRYENQYEIHDDTLYLEYDRYENEDIYFLVKVNNEDDLKYYYSATDSTEIVIDKSALREGFEQITLQMPSEDVWSGSIRFDTDEAFRHIFVYGTKFGETTMEDDKINIFLPEDVNFFEYHYQLYGLESSTSFNRISDEIIPEMEAYEVDIVDEEISVSGFSFDVSTSADFYILGYIFAPISEITDNSNSSWQIFGEANDIDFELPELSENITQDISTHGYESLPNRCYLEIYKFDNFDSELYKEAPKGIFGLYNTDFNDGYRRVGKTISF